MILFIFNFKLKMTIDEIKRLTKDEYVSITEDPMNVNKFILTCKRNNHVNDAITLKTVYNHTTAIKKTERTYICPKCEKDAKKDDKNTEYKNICKLKNYKFIYRKDNYITFECACGEIRIIQTGRFKTTNGCDKCLSQTTDISYDDVKNLCKDTFNQDGIRAYLELKSSIQNNKLYDKSIIDKIITDLENKMRIVD